jgi:hypothetical protein
MTDAVVANPGSRDGVIFRCQMLGRQGDILFPTDIVAETMDIAIQQAFQIRQERNEAAAAAAERVYAFRVWHDPPAA